MNWRAHFSPAFSFFTVPHTAPLAPSVTFLGWVWGGKSQSKEKKKKRQTAPIRTDSAQPLPGALTWIKGPRASAANISRRPFWQPLAFFFSKLLFFARVLFKFQEPLGLAHILNVTIRLWEQSGDAHGRMWKAPKVNVAFFCRGGGGR